MAGLPHLIRPMLASLRHELPADEDGYGWELKWDGLRAIAYVSGGEVRLVSRNDKEMAASYPELGVLAERVSTPAWHRGGAAQVLAESIAKGLEGVVGKPLASAYHPGQRRDWIKVKNVRQQEVIIGGWKPGAGRRAGMIGSLLVGVYDRRKLRFVGHVGTGFTQDMLIELKRELEPLARDTSPFDTPVPAQHARDARWTEPRLAGEVAFAEWTTDMILRQPSWRGLRIDKDPRDVHRED